MNRADLTSVMAAAGGISKISAERALNAALDAMTEEMRRGGRITLSGFGSFRVAYRRARIGRDPRTGSTIHIDECKTVSFIVSEELKQGLNQPAREAVSA